VASGPIRTDGAFLYGPERLLLRHVLHPVGRAQPTSTFGPAAFAKRKIATLAASPKRSSPARPVAKSGSAAGIGVSAVLMVKLSKANASRRGSESQP
jgi:hypothetical protein